MNKILLTFFLLCLSVASNAQVKKYPPLRDENVDYTKISDNNLLLYKISTTKPLSTQKSIDSKYVIKNISWRKIIPNNLQSIRNFGEILNESIVMREPLKEEDHTFLYFEAVINIDSLPLMMYSQSSITLTSTENGEYIAENIVNLHGINLYFTSRLNDINKKNIKFGRVCNVTTAMSSDYENVIFTIAVKLESSKFEDITSGSVSVNIGGFKVPDRVVIRKSDVGKDVIFDNRVFSIIEFDRGVVHLRYLKNGYNIFQNYKYMGNINGDNFNMKCNPAVVIYAVYNMYRESKHNYEKIISKADSNKRKNIDPTEFEYDVAVYNLGYDIDSLYLYVEQKPISIMLTHAISVSKSDGNYAFNTILVKNSNTMDTNMAESYISRVRSYFKKNIKYPVEAQDLGIAGAVVFKFVLTPTGEISDIEILSSPHWSLSNEIKRMARNSPRLNLGLSESVHGSMRLLFTL